MEAPESALGPALGTETWAAWGSSRAGDVYRNETQTNNSLARGQRNSPLPPRKGSGLKEKVLSDFKSQGTAGMRVSVYKEISPDSEERNPAAPGNHRIRKRSGSSGLLPTSSGQRRQGLPGRDRWPVERQNRWARGREPSHSCSRLMALR